MMMMMEAARRGKKKVTLVKLLGIRILTFLSLGKWQFETKVRNGLISLQSGLHILYLRYAPLTNCKRYSFLLGACFHWGWSNSLFEPSADADGEMSLNDLMYILENGAVSNGFITDKGNKKPSSAN